ncbi:class I SAM-dependent methyltransferase [Actinoallomurus iriomotensis]|nr:class I SAM-dependent methyltransferase [Actinoallomurus iriomotensis]
MTGLSCDDLAMETPRVKKEIIEFYTSRYDEDARLSSTAPGALEFARTQELLRRHLPDAPASVLDIGGGPATHARWLMADGYSVHLIDPVERHLRQARSRCSCTTELGDARALTASDQTYDAALLLGPLYHLPDRTDRLQALHEARRVLRPGGLTAAAVISRHSALLDLAATDRLGSDAVMRTILDSGHHDPALGFTTAYFHTAEELVSEMTEAGFTDVRLYGIEGPLWPVLKGIETHTGDSLTGSPLLGSVSTAARLTETDPAIIAASAHIMAIGYRGPREDR